MEFGLTGLLSLLPSGEKCRAQCEAMRGPPGTTLIIAQSTWPPHPTLRATFSPLGRRENRTVTAHLKRAHNPQC